MILWVKAFHLIAMVVWFAGLFYLPRLFVYHALAEDTISRTRFVLMERKLYYGIMAPGAILTVVLGLVLLHFNFANYTHAGWLHAKLFLVALLGIFHLYCGHIRKQFAAGHNRHGDVFYRWINEFPTVILISVVILAVVKPF